MSAVVPLTDADDWLSAHGFVGDGISVRFGLCFRGHWGQRCWRLEYSGIGVWSALPYPVARDSLLGAGETPELAILNQQL